MRIITGKRQTGKTTQLIHESATTGFYIVCRSMAECKRIADHAKDLGLKIPYPISYNEAINNKLINNVLIDNIIHFAEYACTAKVHSVTIDGVFNDGNQMNYVLKSASVGKSEDESNDTKVRQVYEI